jgi:two-component system response regulator YesN
MYKALVVDDEVAARKTICELIDWEYLGFCKPQEAQNGQQALALAEQNHYDLIFTDIAMPVMDGIALIEQLRKRDKEQKIIVISCHEKFEYAQAAVKLGVDDYLIKDLTTKEELSSYVLNARAELQHNEGQAKMLVTSSNFALEHILASEEGVPQGRQEWAEAINCSARSPMVGLLLIVDSCEKSTDKISKYAQFERLKNFDERLTQERVTHVKLARDQFFALVPLTQSTCSLLNYMNDVIQICNRIRSLAKETGIGSISIGASNSCEEPKKIKQTFLEAEQAVSMRVVQGLNRNILFAAISGRQKTFNQDEIEIQLQEFKRSVQEAQPKAMGILEQLYRPQMMDGFMELNYYRYLEIRLQNIAVSKWEEVKSQDPAFSTDVLALLETLRKAETIEEKRVLFQQVFEQLLGNHVTFPPDNNVVARAKREIEQHYDQPLSLNDIAETLHIHKGYLCRVFKEKAGVSLMQYITNCKITKAKQLLQQDRTLHEISDQLGFTTPQYFSLVFKKNIGMSPQEYHRSWRRDMQQKQ